MTKSQLTIQLSDDGRETMRRLEATLRTGRSGVIELALEHLAGTIREGKPLGLQLAKLPLGGDEEDPADAPA
ncbi:MAG: hypothetical protein ACRENM_07520 [Candidatus Dormibacteraceae bacterium]